MFTRGWGKINNTPQWGERNFLMSKYEFRNLREGEKMLPSPAFQAPSPNGGFKLMKSIASPVLCLENFALNGRACFTELLPSAKFSPDTPPPKKRDK